MRRDPRETFARTAAELVDEDLSVALVYAEISGQYFRGVERRHPDRVLVPGVEISSGSLGHGLPLAVGTALGLRAQGLDSRVVVLVGDAELDEGSNAEAIALAGALGLDALTVVVVDNASTSYHRPRVIAPRFAHEGWDARVVDGRGHDALQDALTARRTGRPTVVVAEVEENS